MFLGWYDPDKKKPARSKVSDAVERYVEKFGDQPVACLTSMIDAEELTGESQALELFVRGVHYIPRHTFYVGVEDAPMELQVAA